MSMRIVSVWPQGHQAYNAVYDPAQYPLMDVVRAMRATVASESQAKDEDIFSVVDTYPIHKLPWMLDYSPQLHYFYDTDSVFEIDRNSHDEEYDMPTLAGDQSGGLKWSSWASGSTNDWGGHMVVEFNGQRIHVAGVVMGSKFGGTQNHYVAVCPSKQLFDEFIRELSAMDHRKTLEVSRSFILTNDSLGPARADCTWGDVILPDGLAQTLTDNISTFFKARDAYKAAGVPYRRGVIFIGPPGNGKTSCLRVLASQHRDVPFFLHGFSSKSSQFSSLHELFIRARRFAPSVLVLEDIDRAVGEDFMRNFLNMLDGISVDEGLLIIATTNNPERLDPALIERPSRFDLIVRFDDPAPEQRQEFLRRISTKIPMTDAQIGEVVSKTGGWSMAMLGELRAAAALRSARDGRPAAYEDLAAGLVVLSESIRVAKKATGSKPGGSGVGFTI